MFAAQIQVHCGSAGLAGNKARTKKLVRGAAAATDQAQAAAIASTRPHLTKQNLDAQLS
jgi:hypothetical protein